MDKGVPNHLALVWEVGEGICMVHPRSGSQFQLNFKCYREVSAKPQRNGVQNLSQTLSLYLLPPSYIPLIEDVALSPWEILSLHPTFSNFLIGSWLLISHFGEGAKADKNKSTPLSPLDVTKSNMRKSQWSFSTIVYPKCVPVTNYMFYYGG